MEENLTIQYIRNNNAEWLLNKLQEMSAEGALQTISNLYDELHKQQYPKTYEECCKVLNSDPSRIIVLSNRKDIIHEENKHCYEMYILYKLLICRDSYWKIAGDWRPVWEISAIKYTIRYQHNNILKKTNEYINSILCFPTEEMRDAFYENFKELIEECKELL